MYLFVAEVSTTEILSIFILLLTFFSDTIKSVILKGIKVKINYQLELEKIINLNKKAGNRPSLLLHACCAPCSSYTLEYLTDSFDIFLLFYNPNISPEDEYFKRKDELIRLVNEMPLEVKPEILDCDYNSDEFFSVVKGLENEPEGGSRCSLCYNLRLEKAAMEAKKLGLDYFASTLSISPMKNAEKLNRIGQELGAKYAVAHLPNDFKKKNGYKRSIELSKDYNLYRQDYCGCIFSKLQRERETKNE